MTISEALNHKLFDDIRQDYVANLEIKGEPISMLLEGIDIPEIAEMAMSEYHYYQSLKKEL